jgi:two-component system cell cycle response regulator
MSASPGAGEAGPPVLAVCNHRGERLASTVAWFQERGWEVRVADHLAQSRELLARERVGAALIHPLTLLRDGVEWRALGEGLSPARPVPWIVLPWEGAPTAALAQLTSGSAALCDWARDAHDWPELEARLGRLLGLQRQRSALQLRVAEVEGQLILDHKTGLSNDRHFRERLREEFERAQRHKVPATLLLLDLDHFKQINDAHSYEYGDAVLVAVGDALRASVRSIDIPARIGGDEFAVILPSTSLREAAVVAHRVRQALREAAVGMEARKLALAASQGLAQADGAVPRDPRQWLLHANEALKSAKQAGRDRVMQWDDARHEPGLVPAATPAQPAP